MIRFSGIRAALIDREFLLSTKLTNVTLRFCIPEHLHILPRPFHGSLPLNKC